MFKNGKFLKIMMILSIIFFTFESAGYYLGTRNLSFISKGSLSRNNGKVTLNRLMARNWALRQRLKSLTPNEIYIVVDTGRNMLYLKKGNGNIREAVISCE